MDATHILGAAFFLLSGVGLVARRRALLDFGALYGIWGVPREQRTRIDAAFTLRARTDALPTMWAGIVAGALALAFAPLVLLTDIPFNTVLGALLFVIASGIGLSYTLRPRPKLRSVASPAVRDAGPTLAWHVWAIFGALAIAPLLWFGLAPIGASLFTGAGLAIVSLAYRFAARPASVVGDDASAEAFVDARVRTTRVAALFALAIVPGYFFEASTTGDFNALMHAVLYVAPLGVVVSNLHIGRATRPMRTA